MSVFDSHTGGIALPVSESIDQRTGKRRKSDRTFNFKISFAFANLVFTSFVAVMCFFGFLLQYAEIVYYANQVDSLQEIVSKYVTPSHNFAPIPDPTPVPSQVSATNGVEDSLRAEVAYQAVVIKELKASIAELRHEEFSPQALRSTGKGVVSLSSTYKDGRRTYGAAGYLGKGYFITVKHGLVDFDVVEQPKVEKVTLHINNVDVPATIVDMGDATGEVQAGDWAILYVKGVNLPPLQIDLAYPFKKYEKFVTIGNDYDKGILTSEGHLGNRQKSGLITGSASTRSGQSGGAIINKEQKFVALAVGRQIGDNTFSYMLPLREEMFRKVVLDSSN